MPMPHAVIEYAKKQPSASRHRTHKAMHPADIQAALKKRGKTQADIATDLAVSRPHVAYVIQGRSKSRRVAEAISKATGIPVDRLWPGKYFANDQRLAA